MPSTAPEAAQLLAAAAQVTPSFADAPPDPVRITDLTDLASHTGAEIVRRYHAHGWALFAVEGVPLTADAHLLMAELLNLGEPFVPPLYSMGGRSPSTVSVISAADNAHTEDAAHPAFGRAMAQGLHCDGTLQPIGFIKATLMSCRAPAAHGGVTTLFDSIGAYADLLRVDQAAALALARRDVLVRRATINDYHEENVGPVYAVRDGRLVGHYCVSNTDSFHITDGPHDDELRRGLAFLKNAAQPGQPYFQTVRLGAGQVISFDNTKISHGRTAYEDSFDAKRCLYRTLHVSHPLGGTGQESAGSAD